LQKGQYDERKAKIMFRNHGDLQQIEFSQWESAYFFGFFTRANLTLMIFTALAFFPALILRRWALRKGISGWFSFGWC
jgi:hypothetical protein